MAEELEVDVLVVGSGAAGLTAALTANAAGQEVLVVEKASTFGGTTALSGGVMWIPNNSLMAQQGVADSDEQAFTYLSGNIGNRVEPAKLKQFVRHAKHMLDSLVARGAVEVSLFKDFPDYNAEAPGGISGGRSVEPRVLAGSKLGAHLAELRSRGGIAAAGIAGNMMELRRLGSIKTDPLGALRAWRVLPRLIHSRLMGERYLSQGAALIGQLRVAIERAGIPLWLESPVSQLVEQDDRVVGAVIEKQGEPQQVAVRCGVIMASGGYDHNEQMRETYQGSSRGAGYTSGVDTNTGDGILAGHEVGGALDLMEDSWWAPTFLLPGSSPAIVIFERGKPGCVVINGAGRRFANEALPYNEFVKRMLEEEQAGGQTDPAWFVFDDDYRRRYPIAGLLPGQSMDHYVEQGFVIRGETMAQLQEKLSIVHGALVDTIDRFNNMARAGRDEDFQRGETAFDRFTGDPTQRPNPCLAPLDSAPFYAIRIYPGDLGTKGGLLTNEFAQVLRDDGTVIEGLYAAGNCSASSMGHYYPGAGGTIGPAMTFGYIAAQHAAGRLEQ